MVEQFAVGPRRINLAGLKRSGHHAIGNWVLQQIGLPWYWHHDCRACDTPKDYCMGSFGHESPEVEMVSFEDCWLKDVMRQHEPVNQRTFLHIVVLRDFRNLVASRLMHDQVRMEKRVIRVWTDYAVSFLRGRQFDAPTLYVSYPLWFTTPSYRAYLARALGVPWTDAGVGDIVDRGGGSSFDKRTFDGKANQMQVLDRWRQCKKEEQKEKKLRYYTQSPSIRYLDEMLFGEW